MYDIQHCFMPPLDSIVSEDAGIEPRTVATTALVVRRSNHSARSHPQWMGKAVRIGTWNFFALTYPLWVGDFENFCRNIIFFELGFQHDRIALFWESLLFFGLYSKVTIVFLRPIKYRTKKHNSVSNSKMSILLYIRALTLYHNAYITWRHFLKKLRNLVHKLK